MLKRSVAGAAMWLLTTSVVCVTAQDAHAQGSVVTDREVLEVFYRTTGGPDWGDRTNWMSSAPLGEWFGVQTNGNGRVTNLDLSGNNLIGTIPASLGQLAYLRVLHLGSRWDEALQQAVFNQLSGPIPPEFGGLANLDWLNLDDNRLSGTIPPEFGGLANLGSLYLRNNELSGPIPLELGSLANLLDLVLYGNELSGTIPPELGGLTNLGWLHLGGNQLSGKIPQTLMQLSGLRSFQIANTRVCVPTDAGFRAWLDTIPSFNSSGLTCDGSLRVAFSASRYEVREGGSVEVTVRLIDQTEGPVGSVTVNLTVTPDGGTSGEDYAGVPERLRITARGASAATFDVSAVEDSHYDDGETIVLGFGRPLPSGVTAGSPDTTTLRIHDPAATGAVTDREVLEVLYRTTGGPDWGDRTNWMSSAPLGEWFGIHTNEGGRVIHLDLDGNQLSGTIPYSLGALADLQSLSLGNNELSGAIPRELGGLANLQELELTYNQLGGAIPPELGDLANLKELGLAGNQLSGTIPRELGGLASLRELWLWGNQLSGAIPRELGGLASLQVLDLQFNQLSGTIPPELASLANLQMLRLGANQLSGTIPPELASLADLQWLGLGINRLSGAIPPELGDLANLKELGLAGNQLSGTIPRELGGLASLRELWLWGNQLSGTIPPELTSLANLQKLVLNSNQLSGTIPPELAALTNLQVLEINANQLSGTIPSELAALTNLESLWLAANQLSGTIPPELGGLANLRMLVLNANQLSGTIPPELGGLANLRMLGLNGNQLSGTIPSELAALTNLESLEFSFNQDLSGMIPSSAQQLPLSTLHLMATRVCVSGDAEFRAWLATIDFVPSGAASCGHPGGAMSSIDIAVFYTPAARSIAGGTAEIEAAIDLLIVETNQAYAASDVNQRLTLVATGEVEYTESGHWAAALAPLAAVADGSMDEVHEIRERVGADLVHLLVAGGGGIANFPGAFSVSCAECGAATFAHELGHNMGLSHDRYLERFGLSPYSYGYVNQRAFEEDAPAPSGWRTIMSYGSRCGDAGIACERILRFSNPNQTYLGDPLGIAGERRTSAVNGPADAVRALNITRHSVASFRDAVTGSQQRPSNTLSRALSEVRARAGDRGLTRPLGASGGHGGGLFAAVPPSKHIPGTLRAVASPDPKTLRRREVSIDIGMLARVPAARTTPLPLNLFEDLRLTGIIERRTPTYSGGYALAGRLAGVAGGTVALVVNGSVVAGTVRFPGSTYRIRPAGAGRHAITQLNPSRLLVRCGTVQGVR